MYKTDNVKDFNFECAVLIDKNSFFSQTLTFNNNKNELKQKILNIINKSYYPFGQFFSKKEIKENEIFIKNEIIKNKYQIVASIKKINNDKMFYNKITLNEEQLIKFIFEDYSDLPYKKNKKQNKKSHNGISKSFKHYMRTVDIESQKQEILIKEKNQSEIIELENNINKNIFKKKNRLDKKINSRKIHKQTKNNSLGWKSKKKKRQWE